MNGFSRCAALAALASTLLALAGCGGGGSSSGSATVSGVTTPSSVSVVTATHESN